jgi:hypothetical protein
VVGGTAVLAACGSSGAGGTASPPVNSNSSGTDSTLSAACPHLTSLRSSLTNLTRLPASPASLGPMGADLSNIEKQLGSLKDLGGSTGRADSDQLTVALHKFTLAAQAEVGLPTSAHLTALRSALTDLKSTAQPMIGQIKTACPTT